MHVLSVPSTDGWCSRYRTAACGTLRPRPRPRTSQCRCRGSGDEVRSHSCTRTGSTAACSTRWWTRCAPARHRAARSAACHLRHARARRLHPAPRRRKTDVRWDRFADDVLAAARAIREGFPTAGDHSGARDGRRRRHSLGAHGARFARRLAFPGRSRPSTRSSPSSFLVPKTSCRSASSPGTWRARPRRPCEGVREQSGGGGGVALESRRCAGSTEARSRRTSSTASWISFKTRPFTPRRRPLLYPLFAAFASLHRRGEALGAGVRARREGALKSVCAPGAVSCPVTIARGSTQAPHDPTLTPYPAFVAGVLAERMGKETASLARLETRWGRDHFGAGRTGGIRAPARLEPRRGRRAR